VVVDAGTVLGDPIFRPVSEQADVGRHAEVADRDHVVELADDADMLRLHADLFPCLLERRRLAAVVFIVTGAAGE
jgi:hypothetical protein